jgi:hypothetical protein
MAHFEPTLLSASLQNLQLAREHDRVPDEFHPGLKENIRAESSKAPFRSASAASSSGIESPLPDPNGLGWPGPCMCFSESAAVLIFRFPAKSTLLRLNATPAEKLEREQRLAGAVRTILECLGEDPDREGLLKTPERYAKALMWMTRGYEERLKGDHLIHSITLHLPFTPEQRT